MKARLNEVKLLLKMVIWSKPCLQTLIPFCFFWPTAEGKDKILNNLNVFTCYSNSHVNSMKTRPKEAIFLLKNYLHPIYIPLPKSLNLGLQGKTFQKLLNITFSSETRQNHKLVMSLGTQKKLPPKIIASFISLLLQLCVGNRRGKINSYIHMFK